MTQFRYLQWTGFQHSKVKEAIKLEVAVQTAWIRNPGNNVEDLGTARRIVAGFSFIISKQTNITLDTTRCEISSAIAITSKPQTDPNFWVVFLVNQLGNDSGTRILRLERTMESGNSRSRRANLSPQKLLRRQRSLWPSRAFSLRFFKRAEVTKQPNFGDPGPKKDIRRNCSVGI